VDAQLHCDHQHLKTAQETQRRIERELSQASEQLSAEKSRNSQLEQDVENYRARQKHISDLKLYQQKRPWIVRSSANWTCSVNIMHGINVPNGIVCLLLKQILMPVDELSYDL